MAKLNDGNLEIELIRNPDEVVVRLDAKQYELASLGNFDLFLPADGRLLAGKITTATEELLEIVYELPPHAVSVTESLKKADLLQRVEIARKYTDLLQNDENVMWFFIHPDNLFLSSNQLYVAHRGLVNGVEPKAGGSDQFHRQYKALVISTLNPKYQFANLATGNATVRDKVYAKMFNASSMTEIVTILDEQYHTLNQARTLMEQSVKKSRYTTFKVLSALLVVLLVGVGIWLGLLLENTVPRQERIIEAHAAFMVNNFGEAAAIMANDDPRTLPSSVQYMLATSHVQLSTLTLNQRQAILNNLSPLSAENELMYWIYLGRGEILAAINLAYIIGDNQLKLHAYAHRYDYINVHPTMPGVERQDALTRYRNRIEELAESLAGRVDDEEIPTDDGFAPSDYEQEDDVNGDE